jgi:hypothetical protein
MDIYGAGLLYEAMNYYEETFFPTDKEVFDILPDMDMIKKFEDFEKYLHRFNRRMRTKRRKCKSIRIVGSSKV